MVLFLSSILLYRMFGLSIPFLTKSLPAELLANEYPFPYEITSFRRIGSDFTYRYLRATIDVRVFIVRERRIAAIRINHAFPENLMIRKDYSLLSYVRVVFPVSAWHSAGRRSKVGLVMTDQNVARQLSKIPEFGLILTNKEGLIAARYVSPSEHTAENLSLWGSILYNLHVYSQNVLQRADFPMENHSQESLCPFCREEISRLDETSCDLCGTLHHVSCWKENGGCAVFGCKGQRVFLLTERPNLYD